MFTWMVAWRFLREGKSQTLFITMAIAVGVAVQVFLNALIGALQADLIDNTVGRSPHITAVIRERQAVDSLDAGEDIIFTRTVGGAVVTTPLFLEWRSVAKQITENRKVSAVSPVVNGSGFATRGGKNAPVVLKGLLLADADQIYRIGDRLVDGEFRTGSNDILIGSGLAEELGVKAGDLLRLNTAQGTADSFTVRGVFSLDAQILNDSWVVLSLPRLQALLGEPGTVNGFELQVSDVFAAETITRELAETYSQLEWRSWQEENAALLNALQSQSLSSVVIQVFILVAVTMGIASVLAVSATQKSRQIGILKAIGAKTGQVSRIFFLQGGALGFVGALVGVVLGWGLITLFLTFTVNLDGSPLFSIEFDWMLPALSVVIATAAGTLAASLPARRSAKLNPVEVIKNG